MSRALLLFSVLLLAGGCKKSPIERTQDAASPTALGQFAVAPTFRIFSSELMTGGGAFEYPGGDNQTLSFEDRSNALSQRSIRYSWNGQPAGTPSNGELPGKFAGFTLMYVPLQAQYDATAATSGRDLRAAGYSKVTFYVRGSLSTNTSLKIEGPDDAQGPIVPPCITLSVDGSANECAGGAETPQVLDGTWRQHTLHVPPGAFASVKDFFKATFIYTFPLGDSLPGQAPGQGGTVYFDQIQYEP
jgi:hypothetical protein